MLKRSGFDLQYHKSNPSQSVREAMQQAFPALFTVWINRVAYDSPQ